MAGESGYGTGTERVISRFSDDECIRLGGWIFKPLRAETYRMLQVF